jgi:NADPH-dependent curcumin reductase CurA
MARWNKQIFYANTPSPTIDPDLSTGTFALKTDTVPESIPDDMALVRIHYLAMEPAMRQWLTAKRSYITPVEKGQIMRGESIAQVLSVGNSLKSRYQNW